MQENFKLGDTVEVIESCAYFKKGVISTITVKNTGTSHDLIHRLKVGSGEEPIYARKLKLVTRMLGGLYEIKK